MSAPDEPQPEAAREKGQRFHFDAPKIDVTATRAKAEFILSRAWGLVRDPRAEWEQIRAEDTTVPAILAGYVAPLAAIIPICSVLGSSVFGQRVGDVVMRTDISRTVVGNAVTFLAIVALVYFLGILINAVAENFDAEKDDLSSQKVAAYSMTPFLLSGFFWLWPPLWWATIVGVGMSAFLLYRGLPPLMKAEPQRAQGYATTVMVAGLVAFILLFSLAGCVTNTNRL